MKDTIIINYEPFTKTSIVFVNKNDTLEQVKVDSNLNDLTPFIVALAYDKGIYNVMTHTSSEMSEEIERMINEYENAQYSQNKIKVEGI
jgi:hypothetical protein